MTDPMNPQPGIGALFDLSFTRFITVSVVKALYILGVIAIGLSYCVIVIASFAKNGVIGALGAMIFGLLVAVIYLFLLRVYLELIVVIFRIGENTTLMARALGGAPPTGGFPVIPLPPPTVS